MIQVGSYVADREPKPLSTWEECTVDHFHDLYYRRWIGGDTKNLSWFGHQVIKTPLDMWVYQELIVKTRPDFIVQTGTWMGGSALFLAMMQDLLGHGRVISIDIEDRTTNLPTHPRITYLTGSSVDPRIVAEVSRQVGTGRAMVILDSDHKADHVYAELMAYSPMVQMGDYLIVEDTNVNGHPVLPDFGPGPMEAVFKFLAENETFRVDKACERFLMTLNPNGYLRRVCT